MLLIVVLGVGMAVLYYSNRPLFYLSLVTVKVDLLAFGGGYDSILLLFHEVVDVRAWLDGKTFLDGIALGSVTIRFVLTVEWGVLQVVLVSVAFFAVPLRE